MNIKQVKPDQAHEVAMMAAGYVCRSSTEVLSAEQVAKAYVDAYSAVKEDHESGHFWFTDRAHLDTWLDMHGYVLKNG